MVVPGRLCLWVLVSVCMVLGGGGVAGVGVRWLRRRLGVLG